MEKGIHNGICVKGVHEAKFIDCVDSDGNSSYLLQLYTGSNDFICFLLPTSEDAYEIKGDVAFLSEKCTQVILTFKVIQ